MYSFDHFWVPIVVDRYDFGSGCDTVFECLLKHNPLSHQTWETHRYKELQNY